MDDTNQSISNLYNTFIPNCKKINAKNNLDETILFYSFQIQTDTWILHNDGKKEKNEDDNRQFCHCLRKDIT